MRVLALASLLIASLPGSAFAGFFFYDSFDDCVLDKMKGQSAYLYDEVEKVCRDKFPLPPPRKCIIDPSQQDAYKEALKEQHQKCASEPSECFDVVVDAKFCRYE